MSKFRIGDEVLCVSPPDFNGDVVGKTGIIKYIDHTFHIPYCVEWDNNFHPEWWCEENSLELLEEEN